MIYTFICVTTGIGLVELESISIKLYIIQSTIVRKTLAFSKCFSNALRSMLSYETFTRAFAFIIYKLKKIYN